MRLVLWDIDGTLIRARALLKQAWDDALATVFELEGELARVEMAGKTDSQIVLEVLALHGWTNERAIPHLDRFRERYEAGLHEVREVLADHIDVLAGAPEAIARLAELGVNQSLLTGNYEAAARLKLGSVGLDHHLDFDIGAFGSDDHDRLKLVPVAVQKGRRLRDPSLRAEDVIVVGDTPRDIACARAGRARAVAVATGQYSADALAEHNPDALLPGLADTEAAVRAILGA
jgi:phosphoglycolate phosphatase-like HAD superfamily hydrolase